MKSRSGSSSDERKYKMKLRQYIMNYKFKSILFRNFIIMSFLVLLPSAFVSIFYNINMRQIAMDEISTSNRSSLYRSSDAIENAMLELFRFAHNLSTDPYVVMFSLSDRDEIIRNALAERINRIIRMYTRTNSFVESVIIYSGITNLVLYDSFVRDLDEIADMSWFDVFNTMGDLDFRILASRKNDFYPYFITLVSPLNYTGTKLNGAVIVNINITNLGRIIGHNSNTNQTFFIMGSDMRLYYSSDIQLMRNVFAPEYLHFLNDRPRNFSQTEMLNGSETIVSSITSSRYHWRYVLLSPLVNYEDQVRGVNITFIKITAAYLVLSIIISFILAVRSFKPIHNIINVLENPKTLDSEYIITDHHDNELTHITSLVRRTQEQNNVLKLELEERLLKLNNAQMRALQSQINPHFLYNTLDVINWMAKEKIGNENEVSKMITTLAQLLRSSLQRSNYLVTVEEEVEQTKLYAKIIEYKNKDKLKIHWEISPDILDCKIVKLSIQPLVENALNHGLKKRRFRGNIYIKGMLIGNAVVICVEDDGVGLDEKKRDEINNHLRNEYQYDEKHVGILNVNQRVKLLFGEKFGVILSARGGIGLRVTISFPQDALI